MKIAIAQKNPVLLDRQATLAIALDAVNEAADAGARLVAFGETFLPGYPVWLDRSDAARFNSDRQKDMHERYVAAAIDLENGGLEPLTALAEKRKIAVVVGIAERSARRGQSLFATAVSIAPTGAVVAAHRKLVPTYEERLAWGYGDAHGLRTWPLDEHTVGVLNCWENWMPLARAALYGQGETLHIAIWPGSDRLTGEVTRFIACEGRSFVVSASALYRASRIPSDFPHRDAVVHDEDEILQNGGSCVAGPDGEWLLPPQVNTEGVFVVDLDLAQVRRERQNFDPAGHYHRPELFDLRVDRRRPSIVLDD